MHLLRNTASNIVIDLIVEQQEMAIVPLPYLLPWVLPRFLLQENHRALGLGDAVAMGSSGGKSVLRHCASSTAGK